MTKRGFPPPPSLLTGKSPQTKDGQLFHILTYGQANMPDFAAQLSPARRWDVINYIRSLQTQRTAAEVQTVAGAELISPTSELPETDSSPTDVPENDNAPK